MLIGLAIFLLVGIVVPLLKLPEPKESAAEAVPERLARLMVEEKPKPPPPPPPELPKPEPPKPKPEAVPQDRVARGAQEGRAVGPHEAEGRAGGPAPATWPRTRPSQTKNLTGAVGADSKAERSLIASKAGSGSSGVQSSNSQPRLRLRRRIADRPLDDFSQFTRCR